jgi:hypothetical protein
MFTGDQEGGRIRRSSQELRRHWVYSSKKNSPGLLLSREDLLILPFLLTSC